MLWRYGHTINNIKGFSLKARYAPWINFSGTALRGQKYDINKHKIQIKKKNNLEKNKKQKTNLNCYCFPNCGFCILKRYHTICVFFKNTTLFKKCVRVLHHLSTSETTSTKTIWIIE